MSWRPRRTAGIIVALSVVLLAPGDCNIDIGNLSDFIVTHEITVTNSAAAEDAIVVVIGQGTKRRSILKPGAHVTVTAYSGNSVLISASPARDVVAELAARRDALIQKLDHKPLDLAGSIDIQRNLSLIMESISHHQQTGHGSLCAVDLKVDDKGKGNNVSAVATLNGDKFDLACS